MFEIKPANINLNLHLTGLKYVSVIRERRSPVIGPVWSRGFQEV
jgi:hypothetical protein